MPPRSDLPTARVSPAPVVLVIACPAPLSKRCRDAAIQSQALVVEADTDNAATLAAQTRPLVLVLFEEVYASDPASFHALAADVRAKLVLLHDEEVSESELAAMVENAILEAEAQRESYP